MYGLPLMLMRSCAGCSFAVCSFVFIVSVPLKLLIQLLSGCLCVLSSQFFMIYGAAGYLVFAGTWWYHVL